MTVAKTKERKKRSWGTERIVFRQFWKPSPVAHGSPFSATSDLELAGREGQPRLTGRGGQGTVQVYGELAAVGLDQGVQLLYLAALLGLLSTGTFLVVRQVCVCVSVCVCLCCACAYVTSRLCTSARCVRPIPLWHRGSGDSPFERRAVGSGAQLTQWPSALGNK